jgi:hypothetical protein
LAILPIATSALLRTFAGPVLLFTSTGMSGFFLGPALLNSYPQDEGPKIVERSVDNFKRDWAAEPRFDYSERDKDKNGIKTYQDILLYGSPYQKLIALDDQPLNARQQGEEEQKLQTATARRERETASQKRQRIARYEAQRKHATQLILELTKAFSFTIAGTDKLGQHQVYVLNAEPRKGYVPPNTDARVLTGMRGKLWIERTSLQWVKVDVEVFRPVSIAGFFARVEPGTRFELEQEPVSPGIWLPSHFAVRSRSKVVFLFNHQTDEDDTYFDYHPAQTSTSSAAGS